MIQYEYRPDLCMRTTNSFRPRVVPAPHLLLYGHPAKGCDHGWDVPGTTLKWAINPPNENSWLSELSSRESSACQGGRPDLMKHTIYQVTIWNKKQCFDFRSQPKTTLHCLASCRASSSSRTSKTRRAKAWRLVFDIFAMVSHEQNLWLESDGIGF